MVELHEALAREKQFMTIADERSKSDHENLMFYMVMHIYKLGNNQDREKVRPYINAGLQGDMSEVWEIVSKY